MTSPLLLHMKASLQGRSLCSANASWAEFTPGARGHGCFLGHPRCKARALLASLQCQSAPSTSAMSGDPQHFCNAGLPMG